MNDRSLWTDLRTCVSPQGRFVFGLHMPRFLAANLRPEDVVLALGQTDDGRAVMNNVNFPAEDVEELAADPIYEVANPFPFRGTTFIGKRWADGNADDLGRIAIAPPPDVSLGKSLKEFADIEAASVETLVTRLPRPIQLALATTSTDPEDLKLLAKSCCRMRFEQNTGHPTGLAYETDAEGRPQPCISDFQLYEAVANNPCLDNAYKEVMVLRPGIQGTSEIVGQWHNRQSHVFEYLRRNSYIPWGHYAANMAHDAVRYAVGDLNRKDILGLRHLYYQRTFIRMAAELGKHLPSRRKGISIDDLEDLRQTIFKEIKKDTTLSFSATLWGWNYGFDYAPSGYRLHASHQQIHQQYALIPDEVTSADAAQGAIPAFACGDMIRSFIKQYKDKTGRTFFHCYEQAIRSNERMDGRSSKPSSLVVFEDEQVLLFVPKAQTSQWELQLMPRHNVGNILEADTAMRHSLDNALLTAMRVLTAMGAAMITVIEYSKRFNNDDSDQRLLYSFLPRLPESPGAFSEAQLRWINGHYPEDFAAACRLKLEEAVQDLNV